MIPEWIWQLAAGTALALVGWVYRKGDSRMALIEAKQTALELRITGEFPTKADHDRLMLKLEALSKDLNEVRTMVVRVEERVKVQHME